MRHVVKGPPLSESGVAIEAIYSTARALAGGENVAAQTTEVAHVLLQERAHERNPSTLCNEILVEPRPAKMPASGYWDLPLIAGAQPTSRPIVREVTGHPPGHASFKSIVHHGDLPDEPHRNPTALWMSKALLREQFENGDALIGPSLLSALELSANIHEREWQLAAGISVVALRSPTLPPATRTNTYLVGSKDFIIVDPATPDADERAAFDEVIKARAASGRRPLQVWLTHHHGDHIADASRLAKLHGIEIAAHPETARRLAAPIAVSEILDDGVATALRGPVLRKLRPLFTPGHAPGHFCFIEDETKFCIAGDMVAGLGTILVDPSEGDMTAYLASLRQMIAEEPTRLLPAHGPILADPRACLERYIVHRLWRESRVLQAVVAQSGSAADLVPHAYSDVLPAFHGLAERSLLAHLEKLEVDGLAYRVQSNIHRDKQVWKSR